MLCNNQIWTWLQKCHYCSVILLQKSLVSLHAFILHSNRIFFRRSQNSPRPLGTNLLCRCWRMHIWKIKIQKKFNSSTWSSSLELFIEGHPLSAPKPSATSPAGQRFNKPTHLKHIPPLPSELIACSCESLAWKKWGFCQLVTNLREGKPNIHYRWSMLGLETISSHSVLGAWRHSFVPTSRLPVED